MNTSAWNTDMQV